MNYLLDTCVISELTKQSPDKNVVAWINNCNEENLYLSVITIGEIQKGISKLADSKKKKRLQEWLEADLLDRFSGRIVDIEVKTARKWGGILAEAEKKGEKMPVIDAMIAASAIINDLTVATRNIGDYKNCEVAVINLWDQDKK